MTKNFRIISLALCVLTAFSIQAREIQGIPGNNGKNNSSRKTVEELCQPAQAKSDLNINNVRATILGGGDMWWDLNVARYEVPKGQNKHSMFAGALWLGGVDEGNQLKLAAMTYRQGGNDYWPGPLSTDGLATVTSDVCERYDRHWIIYREQVQIHKAWLECKNDPDCDVAAEFPGYEGQIPDIILNWPAHGVDGELPYKLAPFVDMDGDEIYDPFTDYPAYDLDREFDCRQKEVDLLYGDQTIWWVYNDRGNIHSETQADALGFEIRAQAFAFTTNDEVNDMTFNNYRIINRSTFRLTDTYFTTWFDPDLGNPNDDIIGSDIPRGLGYCYNSDNNDEGPLGYGLNPPAVGFDFFQGPFADYFDGRDNDRDGCIDGIRDENGNCVSEDPSVGRNERIIMSGFMYYNNTANEASGNPNTAAEFYNYMRSRWKNGNPLVVETPDGPGGAGNGDGYTANGTGLATLYAYPGNTYDTTGVTAPTSDQNWFESPDNKEDKRGLHNAGPFSLAPGALNFITTGVVWARDFLSDEMFSSVEKVLIADDKAQSLFDNCFQVLDGPDAPNIDIVELNRELILQLRYSSSSNNADFDYVEEDPLIPLPSADTTKEDVIANNPNYFNYLFEGFQIFQLAHENVSIGERYNSSLARLVAQVDVRNNVTQLINWDLDPDVNNALRAQDMTLESNNDGINMTFSITSDAFATTSDSRLVNHKEYYYTVIAYAYNEYQKFDPFSSPNGQRKPFLAGRNNIKTVTGIPHRTEAESDGMELNSEYGDGVEITRIEGVGNSGIDLMLTPESEEEIVVNGKISHPTYLPGRGPVNVKIVDPKSVVSGQYEMRFDGVNASSNWTLTKVGDPDFGTVQSRRSISYLNEQIIPEAGLSITVENVRSPGFDTNNLYNNGLINSEIIFADPTKAWLSGVPDDNSYTPFNWLLSGSNTEAIDPPADLYPDYEGDPEGILSDMVNSTWGPFYFASSLSRKTESGFEIYGMGPAESSVASVSNRFRLDNLSGVDVVYTSDRSKWTRVPVLETGEDPNLTKNGAVKHELRKDTGWKLQGGQLVPDPDNPGWSYFPGYAIDVATGTRLNMAFGENSWLPAENGSDMLWNPTATYLVSPADNVMGGYRFGGQHYVYVFAPEVEIFAGVFLDLSYKGANPADHPLYTEIQGMSSSSNRRAVFKNVMYVNIPMTAPNYSDMDPYTEMPTDARVRIRLNKSYGNYVPDENNKVNNGNPMYLFNTTSFAAKKSDRTTAESELDNIRVVPNPYYAQSTYETSQLDNLVKITNLPQECVISIFSTNGTLVRQINKDNSDTWVYWDLKNDYNVPIASGVYIIHIDAGDLGEAVVKWFGALRPVDLNAF